MTENEQKDHSELVEYRLQKLEEAVATLVELKDIVLKWSTKFENMPLLQCPVHEERLKVFGGRLDKAENDIADLKKFTYKAAGALVVISIIIQLLGPLALDYLKPHTTTWDNAPRSQVQSTNVTVPVWGP